MRYKEFLATIALATSGPKPVVSGVTPRPRRILVVDDERDNLELLQVVLAHEGFHARTVSCGADAITTVAAEPPDLILLDVMMPGMDGYEVARYLKNDPATAHIPIIMITALDTRAARKLAQDAGAEDFVTKPLDRGDLCARVWRLLHPAELPRSA
jgi:CheY-like chemotaxis protein